MNVKIEIKGGGQGGEIPEYICSACGFNGWSSQAFNGQCTSCGVRMKIIYGQPPAFAVVDKPKRIQRQRTKGWRMPPDTVYVGRGSKWGNPFVIGKDGTREQVIEKFKDWILWGDPEGMDREVKKELRGKDLACWCKPGQACHADVLLEVANG